MKIKFLIGFLFVVLVSGSLGIFGLHRVLSRMDCNSHLSLETARTFVKHILQHEFDAAYRMTKTFQNKKVDADSYQRFVQTVDKQFHGIQTTTPHITLSRSGQPAQSCMNRLQNLSSWLGNSFQLTYYLAVLDFRNNDSSAMMIPVKVILEQQPGGRWTVVFFATTAM